MYGTYGRLIWSSVMAELLKGVVGELRDQNRRIRLADGTEVATADHSVGI